MKMDNEYKQMMGAVFGLWVIVMVTAALAFYAGRLTMQLRVDVQPSVVNVAPPVVNVKQAEAPRVEVTVPPATVNVQPAAVNVPPPTITVENKVPPSTVNIAVDGKTAEVKRVTEVKLPVYKEQDPEGRLLPPPK
jgi:hypothetical protein